MTGTVNAAVEEREAADMAALLHATPFTVNEIVRLMRGQNVDVDADDVARLLRERGIRPRTGRVPRRRTIHGTRRAA